MNAGEWLAFAGLAVTVLGSSAAILVRLGQLTERFERVTNEHAKMLSEFPKMRERLTSIETDLRWVARGSGGDVG